MTATGTFSDKNAGQRKTVTLSDLALSGNDAANYVLAGTGQQASTTADISAKEVTVTGIKAKDQTYDKTTAVKEFDFGEAVIVGKEGTDNITLSSAKGDYSDAKAGQNKAVTMTEIVFAGEDRDNYSIKPMPTDVKGSIDPKPITFSWNVPTETALVYNGQPKTVSAEIDSGCVLANDDVAVNIVDNAAIDAGSYTAKIVTTEPLTGADKGNYTLAAGVALTQNYTITKADLTLTPKKPDRILSTSQPKPYEFNMNDLINNIPTDGGAITYDVVGNTTILNASGEDGKLTFNVTTPLGDGKETNVSVTVIPTKNYNTPEPVTVTFVFKNKVNVDKDLTLSVADIEYGQTPDPKPSYSGTTDSTSKWSEVIYTTKDGVSVENNDITKADVGEYTATISYDDSIYVEGIDGHAGTVSADFKITEKTIGVTWSGQKQYVYSGSAPGIVAQVTGVINGDVLGVSVQPSTMPKDAGSHTLVAYALTGDKAGNYAIDPETQEYSFKIVKKEITISGIKANDKDYDGTADAELNYSGVTYGGIIEGETLGVKATGAFADVNAREGETVNLSRLKLTGDAAKNYELAASGQQTTATATIRPKKVNAVWDNTSLTYNGKAQKPSATAEGVNKTLTLDVSGEQTNAGSSYEATAALKAGDSVNYTLIEDTSKQSFAINPKALTEAMVSDLSEFEYTGSEIKPEVVVVDKAISAEKRGASDYKVTYSDNINVTDSAKAVVEGQGNYAGTVTKTFKITPAEISGTVTISATGEIGPESVLTASAPGEPSSYEWYVDGEKQEGSSSTWTVPTDLNEDAKEITVKAIYASGNYTGELTSDPVEIGKTPLNATVAISASGATGDLPVGTVVYAAVTPEGADVEIQWLRDGEPIPDAAGETYTVTADDYGKSITAKVTPKDEAMTGEAVSNALKVESAAPEITAKATDEDAKTTVTWEVKDNGANITEFVITVKAGDKTVQTLTAGQKERSKVVTGLTNGTTYSITVEAFSDKDPVTATATAKPKASGGGDGGGGGGGGGAIDDETNTITIPKVENGSATVSPKSAAAGDKVTVTPKANEGFEPDGVEVTDSKGKPVEVKDNGDGTYSFIMPDGPVTVTPTFKPSDDHEKVCPAKKFTDVDITQWYHLDLDFVLNEGMMNGTSDTTFDPQGTTNRAMIVTILYRLEGEPKAAEAPFTDLTQDWYKAAVGWAAENGIVKGTSATTFAPTDPITREQFATILYRYADHKKFDVSQKADLSKYTDQNKIHDYAKDAFGWANAAGLITGMTETTLQPTGNATRAQAAAIFHRFCENVAK